MQKEAKHATLTPLYSRHIARGAQMAPFAGWALPMQFASIREEHAAVREHAGLFDIGHMGVVTARGTRVYEFLQRALTNDLGRLQSAGKVLYTCMCRHDGGILDDLLVYENFDEGLLLVVNGATTGDDMTWLLSLVETWGYDPVQVSLALRTDLSMLALQGPQALELLQPVVSCDLAGLRYYNSMAVRLRGNALDCGGGPAVLSRTGYTGEEGFELIAPADMICALWDRLAAAGAVPCGLGARDLLRLEMGYLLYGQDMDTATTPLQAGLSWVVAFTKSEDFVGRCALEREREAGPPRRMVGLVLDERGFPRTGNGILADGRRVGTVTSGTLSPRLNTGIALGYVEADVAHARPPLAIELRVKQVPAHIVDTPFYHPPNPARAQTDKAKSDA